MKLSLVLFAIAILVASSKASSMPLVYECKIYDYLDTGVEVTDFQYFQLGESVAHDSAHSTARIYVTEDRTLHLSIRPKANVTTPASVYSAVVGYKLPHRLDVTLAHGFTSPAYAASVRCAL